MAFDTSPLKYFISITGSHFSLVLGDVLCQNHWAVKQKVDLFVIIEQRLSMTQGYHDSILNCISVTMLYGTRKWFDSVSDSIRLFLNRTLCLGAESFWL